MTFEKIEKMEELEKMEIQVCSILEKIKKRLNDLSGVLQDNSPEFSDEAKEQVENLDEAFYIVAEAVLFLNELE